MPNVKLGKLPKREDKRNIQLRNILKLSALPPLPSEYNLDASLGGVLDNNMYGNDMYGDCVIAGRAHQTLRFEKFEQGILITITDKEVIDQYFKESGGFDRGLVMLNSLNSWRKEGWKIGDKIYNIYAYAEVNPKDHDEVKYCILLLGGCYLGFSVPQSSLDQFDDGLIWDVVPNDGGIQGGHAIYVLAYLSITGYNETGPICMTWGKRQQMTWAFWDKYVDEAYGVIDNRNDWQENSPVDVAKLDGYLREITSQPPNPEPSTCPIGRGTAKIMNVLPRVLRRQGRFHYMNR